MVTQDKEDARKFTIAFNCVFVTVVSADNPIEAVNIYFDKFKEVADLINNDDRYIKLSPPTQSLELYAHATDNRIDA